MNDQMWHTDYHSPTRGLTFGYDQLLYKESSEYQTIEILHSPDFGKVMLLDGVLMLTERDEFVYHEMLCHPTLYTHPAARKVLIIGGGDCGTLKQVLSHPEVTEVVQVEIDPMVTRVAETWFPQLTEACKDPRASLVFGDGIAYMKQHKDEFDVILVDSTDPVGPAAGLFRKDFFRDCYAALKDDGILTIQSESPWIPALRDVISSTNRDLRSLFPFVFQYLAAVQTYQAGLWMYQMASKRYGPLEAETLRRLANTANDKHYYNPDIHTACFALPNFVGELFIPS